MVRAAADRAGGSLPKRLCKPASRVVQIAAAAGGIFRLCLLKRTLASVSLCLKGRAFRLIPRKLFHLRGAPLQKFPRAFPRGERLPQGRKLCCKRFKEPRAFLRKTVPPACGFLQRRLLFARGAIRRFPKFLRLLCRRLCAFELFITFPKRREFRKLRFCLFVLRPRNFQL